VTGRVDEVENDARRSGRKESAQRKLYSVLLIKETTLSLPPFHPLRPSFGGAASSRGPPSRVSFFSREYLNGRRPKGNGIAANSRFASRGEERGFHFCGSARDVPPLGGNGGSPGSTNRAARVLQLAAGCDSVAQVIRRLMSRNGWRNGNGNGLIRS